MSMAKILSVSSFIPSFVSLAVPLVIKGRAHRARPGPFSLVLLTALLGLSCAHGGNSTAMQASPRIPAAEGSVSVKDGDNGSTKLAVKVKHMAPPDKVADRCVELRGLAAPAGQRHRARSRRRMSGRWRSTRISKGSWTR